MAAIGIGAAILASTALSTIGNFLGGREQSRALRRAESTQRDQLTRQLEADKANLDFSRQVFESGAPFRGLAEEAIPLIRQDLLAEAGTSELFKRGLSKGISGIQSNLARFGLTDSSVSGRAVGEFVADLSARDLADIRKRRSGLLGLRTAGQNIPLAASSTGGTSANIANLQTQQGAVRGGLFGALGETAAEAPLLFSLLQKDKKVA